MNRNLQYIRKHLPISVRYKNIMLNTKIPQEGYFIRLENFLWNIFGKPLLVPEPSALYSDQIYWRKNPNGVWMRWKNEFSFKEQKYLDIMREHLLEEFKEVKYIIG